MLFERLPVARAPEKPDFVESALTELRSIPYSVWLGVVGSVFTKRETGPDGKSYELAVSANPAKWKSRLNKDNFPFNEFGEFRHAYEKRDVSLFVDRNASLHWALGGDHVPSLRQWTVTFLTWVPFLAIPLFVGFILLTGSWWFLLTLPLFRVGFMASSVLGKAFSSLRRAYVGALVIGLLGAIQTGSLGLLALCLT